jgi:tetratricopeptide (TPR) repeat protein
MAILLTGEACGEERLPSSAYGKTVQARFPSEEAWLVSTTVEELSRLASGAVGGKSAALSTVSVQPKLLARESVGSYEAVFREPGESTISVTVAIDDHVFSPRVYLPAARALIQAYKIKARSAQGDGPVPLVTLTDLRPEVIEAENQKVSRWLAANPATPEAHESAAVVLGAFALRESAGTFSDTRPTICAMAAHLAFADALRGKAGGSSESSVARILIDTLSGRQRPALEALRLLQTKPSSPEKAWENALFMRNTGDWRRLQEPERARLIEQLEYVRALVATMNVDRAIAALEKMRTAPTADWPRILMASDTSTVEIANMFAAASLAIETADMARVWPTSDGTPAVPARAARAVAEAQQANGHGEDLVVRPTVISRPMWGRFFERHLLQAASVGYVGLRWKMAAEEASKAFRAEAARDLESLPQFPLLELNWVLMDMSHSLGDTGGSSGANVEVACQKTIAMIQGQPENLAVGAWQAIAILCSHSAQGEFAVPMDWIRPRIPRGTAYEANLRLTPRYLSAPLTVEQAESVLSLTTYDWSALQSAVTLREKRRLTSADFARYGPVADYNLRLITEWVAVATPDEARAARLLERACDIEPGECLTLGDRLAEEGRDEEAAAAFEKAVRLARDRVHVSNRLDWLADHYLEQGDIRRALEVARMAAETSSARGLLTLARAQERSGQPLEAEKTLQAVVDRYNRPTPLQCFYVRQERRTPGRFATQAKSAIRDLFPKGLNPIRIEELSGPPEGGMAQIDVSLPVPDYQKAIGLNPGDAVVALNGIRVSSREQFECAESMDSREIHAIVFRPFQGGYKELRGAAGRTKNWEPILPTP